MVGLEGQRRPTDAQAEVLARDWGYDDGGRYALLAVSGFQIGGDYDTFGTVFAVIDCDTGDQVETSSPIVADELHHERRLWVDRVRKLNGQKAAA